MLSLVLLLSEDATTLNRALDRALPLLADLPGAGQPLTLVDPGSTAASREIAQSFVRQSGAGFIAFDGPVTADEAATLVQQRDGADYVMVFTPHDRIHRPGLAALRGLLDSQAPDLVVTGSGFWLTDPARPLPGPDAARAAALPARPTAPALLPLHPDPRRILSRRGGFPQADPATGAAWQIWQRALEGAKDIRFLPAPVVLPPWPDANAAAALTALSDMIHAAPRGDQAPLLERGLHWVSDALVLAAPGRAPETLAAAEALLRALPRGLRRRLAQHPGAAAPVLDALRNKDKGTALALLALRAEARNEMATRALAAEYATLRHDLGLALPGPEYLMALHARLQGG